MYERIIWSPPRGEVLLSIERWQMTLLLSEMIKRLTAPWNFTRSLGYRNHVFWTKSPDSQLSDLTGTALYRSCPIGRPYSERVLRNNPLAHRKRGLHENPLLNGRSIDLRGTTYPVALPKDLEPHPFSPVSVSCLSRLRPGPGPDNAICHLSILFPRLRLRFRL